MDSRERRDEHMHHHKLITLAGAARLVQTPKTTLRSAAARGELKTYSLACGAVVYHVDDLQRWRDVPRQPGPSSRR